MTMTDLDAVARVVDRILRAERALDKCELSSILVASGWESLSPSPSSPPVRLKHGEITAAILADGDLPFVQFIFHIVAFDTTEYQQALATHYGDEIPRARKIASYILSAISDFEMEVSDGKAIESNISLVWAECRRIGSAYLTIGVEHVDPDDMPIFIMGRLRQRLRGSQHL